MNPISALVSRAWLAARAGLGFKGARDYYEVFGYTRVLTPGDYLAKYARQDIAQRVVDSPCEAVWAYPPEIEGENKAKKLWAGLLKKGILGALLQADRLCAFDVCSVIWIGLPGDPRMPAPSVAKVDDIRYLSSHGAGTVQVTEYDDNASSERYGLPTMYKIRIDRPGILAADSLGKEVHWTRIVHIVDKPLQGRLYGAPRMEPMFNILDDILKIAGGSAETYWLAANRGLQVDVDKEMQFGAGDAEALAAEIDEYQHQLRRVLRTRGVKVENLGSDPVDPVGVFTTLLSLLAAVSGIPQRILIGAEAGQLASEQDRANWAEFINRRRFIFAEPYILTPLFKRLEGLGLLNPGTAEEIKYVWPESFHQNPLEDSQTMSAKARALINLSRQSQYGTPYVGMKEGRTWLGLPPDLPAGDTLPMAKEAKGGKKTGGNAATGGAGGNDGSGDSGGGAQQTDTTPKSDGTADPAAD